MWDSQFRKVLPTGAYPYHRSADGASDLPPVLHGPTVPADSVDRRVARLGRRDLGAGYDSRVPHARAILDDHGRIMVLITHNTDFGDSFEEEATDREYFIRFSVDGYAFGVNALLYAMSH